MRNRHYNCSNWVTEHGVCPSDVLSYCKVKMILHLYCHCSVLCIIFLYRLHHTHIYIYIYVVVLVSLISSIDFHVPFLEANEIVNVIEEIDPILSSTLQKTNMSIFSL